MSALILVVDDERDNRELLEILLSFDGYRVNTADAGPQALASVAQERPDLILLDVMMPGMTGYEVVSMLKANPFTKEIPVVMVTALDGAVRKLVRDVGADGFLSKPLDRTTLMDCVKGFLPA